MKIISSSQTPFIEEFFRKIGEGIVLMGVGTFDQSINSGMTLDRVKEATRQSNVSLVASHEYGEGEVVAKSYIIRKGRTTLAQCGLNEFDLDHHLARSDVLYNVSPVRRPINALIRICSDAELGYAGKDKADLFLLSDACNYSDEDIGDLIAEYRNHLHSHALIVIAGMHNHFLPIYNIRGKVVSKELSFKGHGFHQANLKR